MSLRSGIRNPALAERFSIARLLLLAFSISSILVSPLGQPGAMPRVKTEAAFRESQSAGAPIRGSRKLESLRGEVRAPFYPDADLLTGDEHGRRRSEGWVP